MWKGLLQQEESAQEEMVIMMVLEGHIEIEDPLMEGDIQTKVGDPLVMEDPLEEDILIGMGDPLEEEDTLVEDLLMEMQELLVMEDFLDLLEDKAQGPQGPPGPVRPIIVQTRQVILDTSALENTFDSVGQSMLQLATAQDQTKRQLQQCIQQGQANMQVHTGALRQLATSTYQRNFNYIFVSIPIYDGSDREGFFPWLECLESACFYSGRNIKTEALGRSTGPVQNVIMALPNARSWRPIREELKRCFSDQTSGGHAAAQLENMTQKPNEPLRLYIFRFSIHKSVPKRDACYDMDPS